jgi:hypothetical protein
MCKTRLDTKIHPRLRLRMQSSRTTGASSSTQPQVQDSGRPEDARAAKPEGARFGETRRSIHRRRRSEASGQPEDSPSAEPEDAAFMSLYLFRESIVMYGFPCVGLRVWLLPRPSALKCVLAPYYVRSGSSFLNTFNVIGCCCRFFNSKCFHSQCICVLKPMAVLYEDLQSSKRRSGLVQASGESPP